MSKHNTIKTWIAYIIIKLFYTYTKVLKNTFTHQTKHVCENGGDILEIGFGSGITANMIQKHNIKTHTIIERDDYFFGKLCKWASDKPKVKVVHGDWVKYIPKDKKYDGIFIDLWDEEEDYTRRKVLSDTLDNHTKTGTIFLCDTKKIFDKNLYIDKGHIYEEIEIKPPTIKWYHLLSRIIIKVSKEKGRTTQQLESTHKVIYR